MASFKSYASDPERLGITLKHRLSLVLLVVLSMMVASIGPVFGQTADPTLAGGPPMM